MEGIDITLNLEDWIAEVNKYEKEVRIAIAEMVAESRPLSTLADITIKQEVSFKTFFYVSADTAEAFDWNYNVWIITPYIN